MSSSFPKRALAVATNLAVAEAIGRALGLPRGSGSLAASIAMAEAGRPDLTPLGRSATGLLVAPGVIVAEAVFPEQASPPLYDEPEPE